MKWHTEKRKISDLIPFSDNPRQLTEKQHSDLMKSLKKFDLVEIPAINTNNTILAGHMRLKILSDLGRGSEMVDVRVPDRLLNEKEVKEYNIRSNKNTGGWNFDKLTNAFDQDDLMEWGFEAKEFDVSDNLNLEQSINDKSIFQVIIDAKSEDDQKNIFDRLTNMGFKCKILAL